MVKMAMWKSVLYLTVPTQTKPPLSLNKHPVPYFRRISTVMLCGPDAVEKPCRRIFASKVPW